ncbi:DUF262 domain-containing protein [Pseudoalteromonas sp. SWXJ133]|uniref:DUF262 domain-containing protein n=1 Tax=unclassified Pseudoalteromonas TaxID=194690 RepID=UPI00140C150C|nr:MULTISPECIES: DUF262 domain-containing protein [unclassified Pseudoalteromonas]MBH0022128.1 DUF262 domain-containing protein [Pseudoalteromonas sp. SWXJ133]
MADEKVTSLDSFNNSIDLDEQNSIDLEDEDLGESEEVFDQTEPFDPKKVDVSISNPNLGAIIERLKYDEIDLMPDFQRSPDLWSKQAQSRLIESILIRLPIPAFYFDALNEDRWQVVDGLQRLSAIVNFVKTKKLALTNLEFLNEYEGFYYDDLPRSLKRRIDEFQTSVYLIKPGTPLVMKYSLFNRINTGGLKLNHQEIRHAMSQSVKKGIASKFLTEIVQENSFKNVIGNKSKRMSHQELVLRHMAFRMFDISTYKSSLPKFLDSAMIKLGELSETEIIRLKSSFLDSMEDAYDLFGRDAFRRTFAESYQNRVVNKPLFETVSVNLATLNFEERAILKSNSMQFKQEFKSLLLEPQFLTAITISTANTDNVQSRFEGMRNIIEKYSKRIF